MTPHCTSPGTVEGEMTHTRSCGYFDPEIGCTCCLEERKALATEQTMHRAWRKRAEQAESELTELRAGLAQDAVRAAAERVCWFDWSDNDMDAVAAIDALRKAITSSVPSTVQRRPDETGDEYEARVGLIPSNNQRQEES